MNFYLFTFLLGALPWSDLAGAQPSCQGSLTSPSGDYSVLSAEDRRTLSSSLSQIVTSEGFKVFWWNIAQGKENQSRKGLAVGTTRDLDQNIQSLIDSEASPDLILLGEFSSESISQETTMALQKKFPFSSYIPYGPQSLDIGIQVYSKSPFESRRKTLLSWKDPMSTAKESKSYQKKWAASEDGDRFYNRQTEELIFDYRGTPVSVVPVHLAQPWRQILRSSKNRWWGAAGVAFELFFGSDNPMHRQILQLTDWLTAGQHGARRIVIGDFNLPTRLRGLATKPFRLLKKSLNQSLNEGNFTFPVPRSKMDESLPKMQIDHAFTQGLIKEAKTKVLPLLGSDHYPIYGVFRPETTDGI